MEPAGRGVSAEAPLRFKRGHGDSPQDRRPSCHGAGNPPVVQARPPKPWGPFSWVEGQCRGPWISVLPVLGLSLKSAQSPASAHSTLHTRRGGAPPGLPLFRAPPIPGSPSRRPSPAGMLVTTLPAWFLFGRPAYLSHPSVPSHTGSSLQKHT